MKIVFAGSTANAATTLTHLLKSGFEVVGVITREDAVAGRNRGVVETAVASVAKQYGISLRRVNQIASDEISWLRELGAELGVVVAYGSILSSAALAAPIHGWLNVHYSLLPQLRGAAPVQHALLNGLRETGVTLFRLDEGLDTGDVVAQKAIQISLSDNSESLLSKLTQIGCELLDEVLRKSPEELSKARRQKESTELLLARKLSRADAEISFSKSANQVHNQIRAMNPEPMAFFTYRDRAIRVLISSIGSAQLDCGEFGLLDSTLQVGCGEGSVILEIVQPAGKKPMAGSDWFRGLRVERVSLQC